MTIEEKIKYINKTPKTKIAKIVGVSRQTIYDKIKAKKDIDYLYDIALNINEYEILGKEKIEKEDIDNNKYKIIIFSLEKELKELKKILQEEQDKNKKINNDIKKYKLAYDDYTELLHRYRNQQALLFTYMKIYGRLGNDSKGNQESNIEKEKQIRI